MLFIAVNCVTSFTETKAQSVSVNFSMFQNQLSPYGRWVNTPRYGQVWIYRGAPDFRPYYTDGHWEYTNYGWAWVSDYDWGWAPFHYGRWEYDNFYGWMWIPDYTWGPAWVSWSSYDGYYGWAPLGYGYSINASFNSLPYNYWTFVPRENICDRDIHRHYVSPERNNNFRNAVIINNYYDNKITRGPERKEVERFTHNTIRERKIEDRDRTAQWVDRNTTNTQNSTNSTIERTQRQNRVNDNYRNERVNEPNRPQQNTTQRQTPVEKRIEPQRNQQVTQPTERPQNIPQRQTPVERRIEPQRNQPATQPAPRSQNVPQRQAPMERRVEPQRNVQRTYTPSNNRPANNGNIQPGNRGPIRKN